MTCSDSNIEFLPIPNTFRFIDRTNFRYGQLTVLGYLGNEGKKKSFWRCLCDCGNTTKVAAGNLVSGNTISCGCQRVQYTDRNPRLKHGLSKTPEFKIWTGMRNRCNNPNTRSFADYGERGITVCRRWAEFENFLADMGERPTHLHTIERIDNEKGYTPENCKWVHQKKQARNKRTTVRITYQGQTKSLSEWCDELHKNPKLVRKRLSKGWGVEAALTSPLRVNQFG